jgi:hypothetical protein
VAEFGIALELTRGVVICKNLASSSSPLFRAPFLLRRNNFRSALKLPQVAEKRSASLFHCEVSGSLGLFAVSLSTQAQLVTEKDCRHAEPSEYCDCECGDGGHGHREDGDRVGHRRGGGGHRHRHRCGALLCRPGFGEGGELTPHAIREPGISSQPTAESLQVILRSNSSLQVERK